MQIHICHVKYIYIYMHALNICFLLPTTITDHFENAQIVKLGAKGANVCFTNSQ